MTKLPTYDDENPGLLMPFSYMLKQRFPSGWVCTFFGPDCFTVKSEDGASWDVCKITRKIIPA